MGSRYPIHQSDSFCFHPRIILNNAGEKMVVPCGKCNGCLLHKANVWSMRLGNEIEYMPYSIFVTLTYNNKYLPKLIFSFVPSLNRYAWISDHADNIRFDGTKDCLRKDGIVIPYSYPSQEIKGFTSYPCNCYSSKRDFQLYLKLIRKDVNSYFTDDTDKRIRYFAISEYGPTTHRSHIHVIFFTYSREVADYLLQVSFFKNWQMSDEYLFRNYAHICDSGARGYLTQYVTSVNFDLPIHKESQIKPFRLSSKSPAIGFSFLDQEKISQDISVGITSYTKSVARLDERFVLEYPKNFVTTLFPKCYRYRELSFDRLCEVYGALYWYSVRRTGHPALLSFTGLRKVLHPMTFNASLRCLKWCITHDGIQPFHYVTLLDMYYYKADMSVLKLWYMRLEKTWSFKSLFSYVNFYDYYCLLRSGQMSARQRLALDWLCQSVGFTIDDLYLTNLDKSDFCHYSDETYQKEVDDIISEMVKLPKYNESIYNSPTTNF